MRRLAALILAVTLAWCSAADAKVLWHQRGEIVDANDVLVGSTVGFAGEPDDDVLQRSTRVLSPIVLLRTGTDRADDRQDVTDITLALLVHPERGFSGFARMLFLTPDCTGAGFTLEPGGGMMASAVVQTGYVIHTVSPGALAVQIDVNSAEHGGVCMPVVPTQSWSAYPATLLIDFTDRWTPPFRIR